MSITSFQCPGFTAPQNNMESKDKLLLRAYRVAQGLFPQVPAVITEVAGKCALICPALAQDGTCQSEFVLAEHAQHGKTVHINDKAAHCPYNAGFNK